MGDDWEAWAKLPTADAWEPWDWRAALEDFAEVQPAVAGSQAGRMSPERGAAVLWWRPTRHEELDYDCSGAVDALLQLTDGFAAVTGSWDSEDRGWVYVQVAETLEAAVVGLREVCEAHGEYGARNDSLEAIEAAAAGIRAASGA